MSATAAAAPRSDTRTAIFLARLDAAEDLYLSDPARAAQTAAEALAGLGPAATAKQRAQAARVRAFALGLLGQSRQALHELHTGLDGLDMALRALHNSTEAEQAELPPDAQAPSLQRMRANVLRSLCIAHDQLGDLPEALAWGLRAVEAAREQADALRLAEVLQSVGVVRARLGDHATALEHQLESLAAFEAAGRVPAAVSSLCNVGISYKNLGRPQAAVDSLLRAMALARAEGDAGMAMSVCGNLAEPLRQLGRLDEALQAARQIQEHMQNAGVVSSECHCQLQVGLCLQALGDLAGAQAAMERALELARREGANSSHHLPRVHAALHALHKKAGRYEQALQHHEALHAAERALFNVESARSLNALQVRFDLERARHDTEVQRLKAAELAALSQTDALTGLANRRQLDQRLAHETLRAQRLQHPLALAIIDIDNFKQVNDRHGQPLGDAVLQGVARLLRQHCRRADLCARYGGEEFCIVFVEAGLADALRSCEALRAEVAAHDWQALAPGLQVTLSIGLASLVPPLPPGPAPEAVALDAPQAARALLAAADQQLYAAKRDGKNRVLPQA